MSERINIADDEIVEVIEKRLPAILSVRPDLKIKMGNLVGLDLVRRDEIFAILQELKIQREEAMEEAMRCGDVEIITGPRQFRK